MGVHDTDPDELAPPPPRSRPYAAPGADPLARRVADRAVDVAERAVASATALEARQERVERRLDVLERVIGEPPIPATGVVGSGMAAQLAELVESSREARKSREAWLTWWRRLGLVVGGLAAASGLARLLFDAAIRR